MNRTPPLEVRKKLRNEVGFGCPIPDCNNPYLEWHHFAPPWNILQHHNPEGMIALCPEHHKKADAGAYTKDQLQKFKNDAVNHNKEIRGKFDWLRNDLLVIVGGNFYYKTLTIFEYKNKPIIWFNKDEEGYLLLNLYMLTTSGEERTIIQDNFWIKKGQPSDLESPPSGKLLKIKYPNEDFFKVEFFQLNSLQETQRRFSTALSLEPEIESTINFPITAVEVHYKVGGSIIEFGPNLTKIGGSFIKNSFLSDADVALSFS